MSRERFEKIRRVLQLRQPDLTVLMDNVHKTHNLAAVTRTCDAVGIAEVHAITNQLRLSVKRNVASGCHKWVKVRTHKTVPRAYGWFRKRKMQVLCAHDCAQSVDFRQLDYTRPTAIVLGAELRGLSAEAIERSDRRIRIPMLGMVTSLNVSVAAALILFEAKQQREAAGLYDQRRLDDATFRKLLFEWTHPQVSAFCLRKGLPYPEMDEFGDIVGDIAQLARTIRAKEA